MTRGTLVIVGTGIRTVGQLTIEAISWLQRADEVIHLVADPIAEETIKRLNPNQVSLQGYYGEGKPRIDSYNEMIEFILSRVRTGAVVCGAFYGHPGVFAYPPHELIRRARAEGHTAFMLPAVSSDDCLFADLGVDPALGGCQSYEATDFLINTHPLDTSSQLVLWQVGALCDWTYRRGGYNLRALPLLVQKLSESYPPTHSVVLYEAPIFIGFPPSIVPTPLSALASAPITAGSTLYIPPVAPAAPDYRFALPAVG